MEATFDSGTQDFPILPDARVVTLAGDILGVYVLRDRQEFGRIYWDERDEPLHGIDACIYVGFQCTDERIGIAEQRYNLQPGDLLRVVRTSAKRVH